MPMPLQLDRELQSIARASAHIEALGSWCIRCFNARFVWQGGCPSFL